MGTTTTVTTRTEALGVRTATERNTLPPPDEVDAAVTINLHMGQASVTMRRYSLIVGDKGIPEP